MTGQPDNPSIEVVSFDMQGTLTDSSYSDGFWLHVLPCEYAKKLGLSPEESKKELKAIFQKAGKANLL